MALEFEWDARKAAQNETKHGISFAEGATVFGDPFSLTIGDPDHSRDEDRYVTMGLGRAGKLLVVVHADRGDRIRIISIRRATARERRSYEGR